MIINMEGDMIMQGKTRGRERERDREGWRKGRKRWRERGEKEGGREWLEAEEKEKCDTAGFEMKERDRSQGIKVV